jgi:hypothetical protein
MNTSEFKFFRRVAKLCPGATLTMLSLMLVFEGSTVTSEAQTSVFVPGNASGCFGSPNDTCVPLVAALTVNGPGTITVTYVSGTVDLGPFSVGPTGGRANVGVGSQYPLQEANAVSGGDPRQYRRSDWSFRSYLQGERSPGLPGGRRNQERLAGWH